MKTSTAIAWGVLAVVVIILGAYALGYTTPSSYTGIFGGTTASSTPTGDTGATPGGPTVGGTAAGAVTYYCKEGQFSATFSASAVQLSLSDKRYFTLPQVQSGSGFRYEAVFQGKDEILAGKGDAASLTEAGTAIYSNCIAAHVTDTDGAKTYVSQSGTFSFNYPNAYAIVGVEPGYTTEWNVNATTSGMLLAEVQLPASAQPKTNFAGAQFTIGTSADPAAVHDCLMPVNGEAAVGTVQIGGLTWTKLVFGDAGAGNIYNTTMYRIIRGGQCYALDATIHSTQLSNYPASAGIKAFDQASVQSQLGGIAASFKFLK